MQRPREHHLYSTEKMSTLATIRLKGPGTTPKEWISWKLKSWTLISLILLTIAIVAAIAVLDALSRKHSGLSPFPTT